MNEEGRLRAALFVYGRLDKVDSSCTYTRLYMRRPAGASVFEKGRG
jgi:hypothetical protein